ncbi:8-amino-7-oxononanoate synthase [Thalassolituus maritimus]|uniref:8-amino-7-oxononanoate synthase n=1 Tax=Thalassolituus maritimus TaxID=484498 RepID=A0ABP9ZVR4_9GAMM
MGWQDRLTTALQQRQANQLERQRRTLHSAQGPVVSDGTRSLVNFCSNDYLGLAATGGTDLARAAEKWQFGSGASHMVCGHSSAHHALEEELARLTGYPKVLLFSTGFMANIGAISALAQRGDLIIQDKLNHASLLDGAQLSRARMTRYRHQDYDQLTQLLQNSIPDAPAQTLIVSDSIFSMDGDLADIERLSQICTDHDALLMVDDAHGLGVLGEQGCGVRGHFNLTPHQLPVYVGTLGKALGGYGAFIAGEETVIDYLTQFARSYIYTTAFPPAIAEAMLGNIERARDNQLRQQLSANIQQFRTGAIDEGLPLMASDSPIQPLLTGDSQRALDISERLRQSGYWVTAIRPPTVPQGEARLRVTLSAAHTTDHIKGLLDALTQAWHEAQS